MAPDEELAGDASRLNPAHQAVQPRELGQHEGIQSLPTQVPEGDLDENKQGQDDRPGPSAHEHHGQKLQRTHAHPNEHGGEDHEPEQDKAERLPSLFLDEEERIKHLNQLFGKTFPSMRF